MSKNSCFDFWESMFLPSHSSAWGSQTSTLNPEVLIFEACAGRKKKRGKNAKKEKSSLAPTLIYRSCI
jgi:hypothetical protein